MIADCISAGSADADGGPAIETDEGDEQQCEAVVSKAQCDAREVRTGVVRKLKNEAYGPKKSDVTAERPRKSGGHGELVRQQQAEQTAGDNGGGGVVVVRVAHLPEQAGQFREFGVPVKITRREEDGAQRDEVRDARQLESGMQDHARRFVGCRYARKRAATRGGGVSWAGAFANRRGSRTVTA